MGSMSPTPQWSIPSVGVVYPSIDRVIIVSPFSVGRLKSRLPISELKQASHAFDINTYQGENLIMASTILLTCAGNTDPLLILKRHEHELGGYSIAVAEISFDMPATSLDDARAQRLELVRVLAKRNHQRKYIRCVHKPDQTPPAGCLAEPSIYFEGRSSSVKLKCYVRREKLPDGHYGNLVVRLEWTLAGKTALQGHLGGNHLAHLLGADLNSFFARHLRLERVDHVELGNLICWSKQTTSGPEQQTRRSGGGIRITAQCDRPTLCYEP